MRYRTSESGKHRIKGFENYRKFAYPCAAGVWTLAWGHTVGVREGMFTTLEEGEEFFRQDIANVDAHLNKVFEGVELSQEQWDALASLQFNLKGGIELRAPKLTAFVRAQKWEEAAKEFDDIIYARVNGTKKVLKGLVKRRAEEKALFLLGSPVGMRN